MFRFICSGLLLFSGLLPLAGHVAAQSNDSLAALKQPASEKWRWIKIQGYMQLRYNELFETNPNLECEQCDKSWGNDLGLYVRRMRFSVQADLLPGLSFTIQPDISGLLEPGPAVQLRDLYFEYAFDKKEKFRVRLGQTRVPYSFENLQSTRHRIPLDRNDALNSAFINERDWGLFFYWTPEHLKEAFKARAANGLKGAGDYGLVSVGIFQGQSTLRDLNRNKHTVVRVSYPFNIGNQFLEASLQAYTGRYTLAEEKLSPGVRYRPDRTYRDRRIGASFIWSPKPFGIQTEYNIGTGPEFDPSTGMIMQRWLRGGYVMLNYRQPLGKQTLYPYFRAQYYDGAKKHERDARHYQVKELEIGMDWQLSRYVEFMAAYTISDRRFEDFKLPHNDQEGSLFRLQLQVGF